MPCWHERIVRLTYLVHLATLARSWHWQYRRVCRHNVAAGTAVTWHALKLTESTDLD